MLSGGQESFGIVIAYRINKLHSENNYRDSAGYGIVPSHAKYIRHVFSRNSIFIAPWYLPDIY